MPAAASSKNQLHVTLLSGQLGSGKTTLLKEILTNKQDVRCAVIVNEISEENIDAYALGGTKLIQQEEKVVAMENGCICCTLREDLIQQLRELHDQNQFDSVLIESSGLSDPLEVSQSFFADTGDGLLNDVARLDTCVTVVDASTLLYRLRNVVDTSAEGEGKKNEDADSSDIGRLVVAQIEFANVIVLNKCDKLAEGEADTLTRLIRNLNKTAKIIPATHCKVPLSDVLNTNSFSVDWAEAITTGFISDLANNNDKEEHVSETIQFQIQNTMFRSERPFHPKRLHQWITQRWILAEPQRPHDHDHDHHDHAGGTSPLQYPDDRPTHEQLRAVRGGMLRVKGFMWLGNPSRTPLYYKASAAGDHFELQTGGFWEEFPSKNTADTAAQEPMNRLAILGQRINVEQIKRELEACLLTEEEEAFLDAKSAHLFTTLEKYTEGHIGDDEIEGILGENKDGACFEDPFPPQQLSVGDDDDDDEEFEEMEEMEEQEAEGGFSRRRPRDD